MARFHTLEVTDVRKTIRDAVVVTLKSPEADEFDFIPGQYLTFRRSFDGTELRRSYSICAAPHENQLQVGIKKVDGGAFSTWANDELKPGMVLEAMPPMGNFHTPLATDPNKNYIGFAGGSGITPVLSILKSKLTAEPQSTFTLVYANRGVNTIMFKEELEDLKNSFMDRFNLINVLESGAEDIDLFRGRIDAEKCDALFKHWIDVNAIDTAFICGPEPMMLAIASALENAGLTKAQIKFELFVSAQPGKLKQSKRNSAAGSDLAATKLSVLIDGTPHEVEMDRQTSVLDAALANALDAPYACKAGVCSTCKCKVIEGEVEMITNHALEDYEVERGFVLSCQAYPLTDKIVVDYDQH